MKQAYKSIKCQKCGKEFYGYCNRKYCKECLVLVRRENALNSYYKHHKKAKERTLRYHKKFVLEKETNPEAYRKYRKKRNEYMKKYTWRIKMEVLKKYGGNSPRCACCGETEIKFLTIDHINNDGAKHRKEIKGKLYQWLYKNKYMPNRFQVLCANCNYAKQWYGQCPHKSKN